MEQRQMKWHEITPIGLDGRLWEVTILPEGISYRVMATGRDLSSTPTGTAPLNRAWTEQEIEVGLRGAVERDLVSPPQKVSGGSYEVSITSYDLYDANGKL